MRTRLSGSGRSLEKPASAVLNELGVWKNVNDDSRDGWKEREDEGVDKLLDLISELDLNKRPLLIIRSCCSDSEEERLIVDASSRDSESASVGLLRNTSSKPYPNVFRMKEALPAEPVYPRSFPGCFTIWVRYP